MPTATEIILQRFVADLVRLHGNDLVSVVVYGSAVAGEYSEGESNINCLVLLRAVTPQSLSLSTKELGRWRRDGIVTPLFLDPPYLEVACELFAIELLDIRERYRVVHGADFVLHLSVNAASAALQCEREIKAKWLRLRQLYLEQAHSPQAVQALLLRSVGSFLALFRALLRSKGYAPPLRPEAILDQLNSLGLALEASASIVRLRRSKQPLPEGEVHALFERYLGEIRAVVDFIDQEKEKGRFP